VSRTAEIQARLRRGNRAEHFQSHVAAATPLAGPTALVLILAPLVSRRAGIIMGGLLRQSQGAKSPRP
jgi:hypothetical protein